MNNFIEFATDEEAIEYCDDNHLPYSCIFYIGNQIFIDLSIIISPVEAIF